MSARPRLPSDPGTTSEAPAVALARVRYAAESRGEGRLYGAAARANLRRFGEAMEADRASPLRKEDRNIDPRVLGGYSEPGPSPRDPRTLTTVMGGLLASRGWSTPVAVGSVLTRWDELVGPGIAEHCRPESFADGVVTVRCGSTAYAAQLRLLQQHLLDRFRQELGDGVVVRLEILGPQAPSWSRGRRRVQGRGPRDTYG